MHFELTKEFLEDLQQLLDNEHHQNALAMVEDLHPADIAEVYMQLDMDQARDLHLHLDQEKASGVLLELEEADRKKFLKVLPGELIARQYIENMDSDDAVDVINELPEDKKDEVLSNITDVEKAGYILDLIDYPEDTAGGLMAKELVTVNENWTIMTCLREMRKQAEIVDEVYYVYVVNDQRILKGTVSLKKMLITDDHERIKNIYDEDIISVRAMTPSEEIINVMQKYDLVALPVVDPIGRLLGRITIDDVVDVIQEEAKEDYQLISGISRDVGPSANVFHLTRARFPWLLIGLAGGILGARVIGSFETELEINPQMAFFIPLIAAMGGNVGVQSSSIIVQGLANKSIGIESTWKKLFREFLIAGINGLVLSALLFLVSYLFDYPLNLTYTVSIALFAVILFASIFGTFIPLFLDRFNIDPALATGPFITTVNDIMGIMIYFLMGRVMYAAF